MEYLTYDEIRELINTIELNPGYVRRTKNKAIILTLFCGGLNPSELSNLKHENVKIDENIIVVGDDEIKINDETSKALKRLKSNTENTYLFSNYKGNKISTRAIHRTIKDIALETDKRLKTNIAKRANSRNLRNSLAIYLINKGKSLVEVKKRMRHKNIESTAKYFEAVK